MPGESFRFIHASDFHLESPLGELDMLPTHLHQEIVAAPANAAKLVFDAALSQKVDFLLLSGDLLHPETAGPSGISLLLEQFQRLADEDTPVFWAAGTVDDPIQWPAAIALPENVTLFPKDHVEAVPVQRAGRTICRIIGRSNDGRTNLHVPGFECGSSELYSIGLGYGQADVNALAEGACDLWCLGGRHQPEVLSFDEQPLGIYSGTPQGRSLTEPGAHGYCIVDVDADQQVRITEAPADRFRYQSLHITAEEQRVGSDLKQLLDGHLTRLQHDAGERNLIVGIHIDLHPQTLTDGWLDSESLLSWAREQFGRQSPATWATQVVLSAPEQYPSAWSEEETILADFLQVANTYLEQGAADISLLSMTEEQPNTSATVTALLGDVSGEKREQNLQQATLLGAELLRGGKPNWVQQS